MTDNAVCCWDFTLKSEGVNLPVLLRFCRNYGKAFAFQLELGSGGYEHYQGRLNLKLKERLSTLKAKWTEAGFAAVHLSPTSNANKGNMFYVMKDDGRKSGPWTDKDMDPPKDMEAIMEQRWPWQEFILNQPIQPRIINVIVDTKGDIGKTELLKYAIISGKGEGIPGTVNDGQKLVAYVLDLPKKSLYIADIPRSLPQSNLLGLYAALEMVKSGWVTDWRYNSRREIFAVPNVWVFTNTVPDRSMLSKDRWRLWEVNNLRMLVPYTATRE